MSEACGATCSTSVRAAEPRACPRCRRRGRSVGRFTVAALTSGTVPPRQSYWLCRQHDCQAVYFGEDGAVIVAAQMNVAPGWKSKDREALVCYCFQHTRGDLQDDLLTTGHSSIPERITAEVEAGNCACEVRNPSGRCCLGEVIAAMRETGKSLEVASDS